MLTTTAQATTTTTIDSRLLLTISSHVKHKQATDLPFATKVYNLDSAHTGLMTLVNRILEPTDFFSRGLLTYGSVTDKIINDLRDRTRVVEEEDELLKQKCKVQKEQAVSSMLSEVQQHCQDQLDVSLLSTFLQRNRQVVEFACSYFCIMGIPINRADRVLLVPLQDNYLLLNINSLYYLMRHTCQSSSFPLLTKKTLKQLVKRFYQDYKHFFHNTYEQKYNTTTKNKHASWFPFSICSFLLPLQLQERSLEEQANAGLLYISWPDFKQWLEWVPQSSSSKEETIQMFESTFLSNQEYKGNDSDMFLPLSLPMETNSFRAVYNWPYCEEILHALNLNLNWDGMKKHLDEKNFLPLFDEKQKEQKMTVSFATQVTQQFQIPYSFLFKHGINDKSWKTLTQSEIFPTQIIFPMDKASTRFIHSIQSEIRQRHPTNSLTDILTRTQIADICAHFLALLKEEQQQQKQSKAKAKRTNSKRKKRNTGTKSKHSRNTKKKKKT